MVGDKTTRQQQDNNLVELEASLAPAEAEVGAMAKADPGLALLCFFFCLVLLSPTINQPSGVD